MKILLFRDIEKLGKRGEIVDVRDGYARNYLIPRRMAAQPTPTMYKELEIEKRRSAKIEAKLVSEAGEVAAKIGAVGSVTITVNTNETGALYGSVTPTMVAESLRDQGLKVEPKAVEIAEPIKTVGDYEVVVALHRDVKPKLKVKVVSTGPVSAPAVPAPETK
jgi:large subunit ribosomal protein L9